MTSQKSSYIEPQDIKAVRVDCNDCGASLTLPIGASMNFASVARCPNCGRGWAITMQTSIQDELKRCADAIASTASFVNRQQQLLREVGAKGFRVSLEISEPSAPASSGKD